MSKVENFETKIYSDEEGWKIWLCTERTEWDKVQSFFKAQYPVKGTPQRDTNIIPLQGYYDTLNVVKSTLKTRERYVHYSVGTTYHEDEFSTRFLEIIHEKIDNGSLLVVLKEHNRKTLHQNHLLPGYRLDGTDREFTVYHDPVAATLAKFTFKQKPEGGYEVSVLCIGDAQGRMLKTDHVFTERMLRPESLSNAVFRVLNPLLDEMKMDKEDRLDIVSDISHYFEKCRFGIWHLLKLANKEAAKVHA